MREDPGQSAEMEEAIRAGRWEDLEDSTGSIAHATALGVAAGQLVHTRYEDIITWWRLTEELKELERLYHKYGGFGTLDVLNGQPADLYK